MNILYNIFVEIVVEVYSMYKSENFYIFKSIIEVVSYYGIQRTV